MAVENPRASMLNLAEVAHSFNCSERTIRRRVARGEFPAPIRSGRDSLWISADILNWFAERQSEKRRARR